MEVSVVSMDSTVNAVVEVFMEPCAKYLPRLQRIAAIVAESAGVGLGHSTAAALCEACDSTRGGSRSAAVRFGILHDELKVDVIYPSENALGDSAPLSAVESAPKVDFCLSRQ